MLFASVEDREVVRLVLSRLVSAYFLSQNTIHSTSPTLFMRSAEQAQRHGRMGTSHLHVQGPWWAVSGGNTPNAIRMFFQEKKM